MESREIYDMLLRSIGEHMDAKGRAAVSINGRPALIVTIDRETGEVTARNAITDTTAADAVIDYLNTIAGTKYQKTPKNRGYINARITNKTQLHAGEAAAYAEGLYPRRERRKARGFYRGLVNASDFGTKGR